MTRVRLSPEAELDILKIGRTSQQNWGILQRDRYLSALDEAFQRLADTPAIGRRRNEIIQGLRCWPCGAHVIFYQADNASLFIVRVIHQRRDVHRIFDLDL